jgi:pseudouridine-5'-phosphate glycosidase
MLLAHQAGIRVLATGGIGGVHRGAADTFDISADLTELARTPVAVVCSGVKSMLDIDKTLEMLETLAVPVIGYQTGEFPAFYERSRGHRLSERVESAWEAAHMVHCHWQFEGAGVLLAQPIAAAAAMSSEEFGLALAVAEAGVDGLSGPAVTPALLAKLAQATKGRSVLANQSLIIANARLAAELAVQLLTIKT